MNSDKGFTLVELVVVISIIGVVSMVALNMLVFTNETFKNTTDQQAVQAENRNIANFIEKKVQTASNIEILDEKPDSFKNNVRYIYQDLSDDKIYYKVGTNSKKDLSKIIESDNIDLNFEKKSDTVLNYKLDIKLNESDYSLESDLEVLNLTGTGVEGSIKGLAGKCIAFSYTPNSKDFTRFDFLKSNNSSILKEDAIGTIVSNDEIVVTVKLEDGKDLTNLVPTFETTGAKVKVNNIVQNSGIDSQDFSSQITYTVVAIDGSTKDYTIKVYSGFLGAPTAENLRILPIDEDGTTITKYAWDNSTLKASYSYKSRTNGAELTDDAEFRWYKTKKTYENFDTQPDKEEFEIYSGKEDKTIDASTIANHWVYFEVKVTAENGRESEWIKLSEPIPIRPTNNPLWVQMVEDLWYINAPEEKKEEHDDLQPDGDYSDDIETIVLDNSCKVESLINDNKIQISGDNASGNLYFALPISKYVESEDGYEINFDTILYRESGLTTWGWGMGFNSIVKSNDKDEGYLFQFDPGAYGFVVRRNDPNHNVIKWMGARGDDTSSGEPGDTEGGYGAPYRPSFLTNKEFEWSGTNGKSNDLWWIDYSTEVIFQKQLDGSYIVRARTWQTPEEGEEIRESEPMWFGDFDQVQLDDGHKYNGVQDLDDNKSLKEFRDDIDEKEKHIGFRSWGSGGYNAKFKDLRVSEGFKMEINKSYFLTDDLIYIEMDQEIRDDFRPEYDGQSLVEVENEKDSGNNLEVSDMFKVNDKGFIIKLNEEISSTTAMTNDGIKLTLKRGSVRHKMAGDIKISNGENYYIGNSFDNPEPIYRLDEDFQDGSFDFENYLNGVVKLSNRGSNKFAKKTKKGKNINNDPNGGFIELDQTIDSSFVFSGKVKRLNYSGDRQDKFAISNDNASGYGVSIARNTFSIEKRNNGNPSLLKSENYSRPNNKWYNVILIWLKDENRLIARIYDEDDKFVNQISKTDETYDEFTRFYIHGGHDFGMDDLKIGLFKE